MQIVSPSHKYIDHSELSSYEFIEMIGRTCYKSTDKITEGSAKGFIKRLKDAGHWAMLEHESVYLLIRDEKVSQCATRLLIEEKYIDIEEFEEDGVDYVSLIVKGNLRSFYEVLKKNEKLTEFFGREYKDNIFKRMGIFLVTLSALLKEKYPVVFEDINIEGEIGFKRDLMRLLDGTEVCNLLAEKHPDVLKRVLTHTVLFTCDRGVSHELVRHRPCSFAQESTRYCNYSKDKFGNEITVIKPFYWEEGSHEYKLWKVAMEYIEGIYFALLQRQATPQEARAVLPNSLKTDIIMTATEEEWQHIVNLRYLGTTGKPHPQMVELMKPWAIELNKITNGRVTV